MDFVASGAASWQLAEWIATPRGGGPWSLAEVQ